MNQPSFEHSGNDGADPVNPESDSRLPSGPWSGFYMEDHLTRRGWMHLYMQFWQSEIRGEGTDYVGPWTLQGQYELKFGRTSWVKQYVGKHQVHYEGTVTDEGILGQWNIRNWNQGRFHIWPATRMDLQNRYMEDELQHHPPTIQLGTVPVPGNDTV